MVMEVKEKITADLKRMCEVNLDLKCTTVLNRILMLQSVIVLSTFCVSPILPLK